MVYRRPPLHTDHTHTHTLCYDNLTQIIRNTLPIHAASGRPSWDVRPLKARPRTNGITCVGEHSGVQTGGGIQRATGGEGHGQHGPAKHKPRDGVSRHVWSRAALEWLLSGSSGLASTRSFLWRSAPLGWLPNRCSRLCSLCQWLLSHGPE